MFGTRDQPFRGGQCDVFALRTHSGEDICVRVYRDSGPASSYLVHNEAEYRKAIKKHGLARFQRMLGSSFNAENLIGNPYICLEWAFGSSLSWTQTIPSTVSNRQKVILGVARSTMDLLQIQNHGSFLPLC